MVALSLRVEAVMGNVYRDERLGRRFHDLLSKDRADRIRLPRRDAAKNRLRVTSQRGTDVLIDVPRGTTLSTGMDSIWARARFLRGSGLQKRRRDLPVSRMRA